MFELEQWKSDKASVYEGLRVLKREQGVVSCPAPLRRGLGMRLSKEVIIGTLRGSRDPSSTSSSLAPRRFEGIHWRCCVGNVELCISPKYSPNRSSHDTARAV